MRDVYDIAKFFIKNGADSNPNTYDGNMKLQKLLVFANIVCLAEYNHPLFYDELLAFTNGCVVEKVRLRYKNDYTSFKKDSDSFQPDFSEEEYKVLKTVLDVFGNATAKELSEINHEFVFWKRSYENGLNSNGYHDKQKSIVDLNNLDEDIETMTEIIEAHKEAVNNPCAKELVNGVEFYYEGFELTDEILNKLEEFSLKAEDNAYSVYFDNDSLVIY